MGSTGSGSFSDYSKQKPKNGKGKTGGSSGEDKCERAFSTSLEEVGRGEFYNQSNKVPTPGTNLVVKFDSRLVVCTEDHVEVGYLPTRFNYLKTCMDDGFKYGGSVANSSTNPIPTVTVDIVPV